ncbi:MAG: nuclear transport factor 2 family protein [Myxococcota bacterium]|nr:nuclear transport factor 2 family protein [Myxococcota bacterium]
MKTVEEQIQEMISKETVAWNEQDAEALVSIFHPDMVWPWPPNADAHDPMLWEFPQGRFDNLFLPNI